MFWGDASPPRPCGRAWSCSSQARVSQRVPSGACQEQRRPSRSATRRRVARGICREGVAERWWGSAAFDRGVDVTGGDVTGGDVTGGGATGGGVTGGDVTGGGAPGEDVTVGDAMVLGWAGLGHAAGR